MLNQYFYHGLIKKYISIFGTLFNNIYVQHRNNNNQLVETLKVPLAYAPKQKFLVRISGDPNLDKKVGMQLPRMGFELQAVTYDSTRKLQSIGKLANRYQDNLGTVYNPVPYNLNMNLFIFCKNAEDGTQIIEQILPFFKPEFTITINALPTMGIKFDVPIILSSINVEDNYEGNFEQRRSIVWTLTFDIKGSLYPNIRGKGFGDGSDDTESPLKVIRKTLTDFYILSSEQVPEPPTALITEASTALRHSYILTERNERLITEDSKDGINSALVSSSVVNVPYPLDSKSYDDYGFTEVINFYNGSVEHNLSSGQYESPI